MEMTQKSNSSLTSSGKVLLPGRVTLIARLNAKFAHAKAKAIIQKCVRELENKRWLRKVMEDSGDSKGFFDSTEVVYGLSYHCMTPLHSKYELMLLKDNALIKKKRWKEHYEDLACLSCRFFTNSIRSPQSHSYTATENMG